MRDTECILASTIQSKGGKARAAKLTPEKRSEIARAAAASRWKAFEAGHQAGERLAENFITNGGMFSAGAQGRFDPEEHRYPGGNMPDPQSLMMLAASPRTQQLEALAGAVGLKGAVVKATLHTFSPEAKAVYGATPPEGTPLLLKVEHALKPKRPLPKAGTFGARVIEVMTLMRAEGLEGINSVTIAMRAGFDRATTRAALAHLTTAGHVVSVPKPGSRREKLWRLA